MADKTSPKAAGKGKAKAPATEAKSAGGAAKKKSADTGIHPVSVAKAVIGGIIEGIESLAHKITGDDGAAAEGETKRSFRRRMIGRVTSDKMNKTVTVEVIRNALDPVYKKYVRRRERYKAHDETNQFRIGDTVEIQEHRPLSRQKRWIVTRLMIRPVQE